MEDHGIILIDSSDDEGLPCKIPKIDSTIMTQKCLFQNIRTSDIKTQGTVDDIVVIVDELDGNKNSVPKNGQNVFNTPRNESVKRIELTTLKDKHNNEYNMHISTGQENENDAPEPNLNGDAANSESVALHRSPSTSSADISQNIPSPEFEAFLEACSVSECDIKYKNMIIKKISAIKRKYTDADINFVQSQHFTKFLINRTEKVQEKPVNSIIIFNEVYRELESKKKREVHFTEREESHLRKLYKTLKQVHKRIKYLENQTVDFEEDCNSSYIMLERYKDRLCVIQKKICSFTKENFYSGRQLFRNLDFSSSKYSEINRAIDKLYNKNKRFPSFFEVNQCIRKCIQQHNINISEDALSSEVRSVFTAVGDVLQRRRKLELYDSLTYFVEGSEGDPAEKDPEFEAILQGRQLDNERKIDDVLQKYTECQERNEEPDVSPDSDDSHHVSDDSES